MQIRLYRLVCLAIAVICLASVLAKPYSPADVRRVIQSMDKA